MKSRTIVWLCAFFMAFCIYKMCTLHGDPNLYSKEDATLIIKEKEISEGTDERVYTSYQFFFKFCDGRYIKKELSLYEFKTFEIGEDYEVTYRNDKRDYSGWYFILAIISLIIGCWYSVNSDDSEDKEEQEWGYR